MNAMTIYYDDVSLGLHELFDSCLLSCISLKKEPCANFGPLLGYLCRGVVVLTSKLSQTITVILNLNRSWGHVLLTHTHTHTLHTHLHTQHTGNIAYHVGSYSTYLFLSTDKEIANLCCHYQLTMVYANLAALSLVNLKLQNHLVTLYRLHVDSSKAYSLIWMGLSIRHAHMSIYVDSNQSVLENSTMQFHTCSNVSSCC